MESTQNIPTEAGVVAALTLAANKLTPQIVSAPGGRSFLITPDHAEVKDVTPAHAGTTFKPDHISQGVTLQTTKSLGDYLGTFKGPNTILFADIAASRIVGAIDYHSAQAADRVKHTATLDLPHSVEWKLWNGIDGKHLSQLDFARFLDENRDDITSPVAGDLLDVVRDLHAVNTKNTSTSVRLNTDHVDFEVSASTDTRGSKGGKLEIPNAFKLLIPVYFGEPPVAIEARLRWNETDAGIAFGIMLLRKEQVRQDDFMRVVEQVAEASQLPAVYGRFSS